MSSSRFRRRVTDHPRPKTITTVNPTEYVQFVHRLLSQTGITHHSALPFYTDDLFLLRTTLNERERSYLRDVYSLLTEGQAADKGLFCLRTQLSHSLKVLGPRLDREAFIVSYERVVGFTIIFITEVSRNRTVTFNASEVIEASQSQEATPSTLDVPRLLREWLTGHYSYDVVFHHIVCFLFPETSSPDWALYHDLTPEQLLEEINQVTKRASTHVDAALPFFLTQLSHTYLNSNRGVLLSRYLINRRLSLYATNSEGFVLTNHHHHVYLDALFNTTPSSTSFPCHTPSDEVCIDTSQDSTSDPHDVLTADIADAFTQVDENNHQYLLIEEQADMIATMFRRCIRRGRTATRLIKTRLEALSHYTGYEFELERFGIFIEQNDDDAVNVVCAHLEGGDLDVRFETHQPADTLYRIDH